MLQREDLQLALAEAKLGRFDVLLAYRVGRLSRSVRHLLVPQPLWHDDL